MSVKCTAVMEVLPSGSTRPIRIDQRREGWIQHASSLEPPLCELGYLIYWDSLTLDKIVTHWIVEFTNHSCDTHSLDSVWVSHDNYCSRVHPSDIARTLTVRYFSKKTTRSVGGVRWRAILPAVAGSSSNRTLLLRYSQDTFGPGIIYVCPFNFIMFIITLKSRTFRHELTTMSKTAHKADNIAEHTSQPRLKYESVEGHLSSTPWKANLSIQYVVMS